MKLKYRLLQKNTFYCFLAATAFLMLACGSGMDVLNNKSPEISVTPKISIYQNSAALPCGSGTYNFGGVPCIGSSGPVTFTVENSGGKDLNLTGSPVVGIAGSNPGMFNVTQPSSSTIPASGSTTFTISFNPSSTGAKSATITIDNDDSDENPYTFTVTGTGTNDAPEMNIMQGVTLIPSGSGLYDFGGVLDGSSSGNITFTIQNTGTLDLNLTGSPVVDIGGPDFGMFTVTQPPASTISASGSTTFTISFNPSGTGAKSATITIDNDDSDENPYTFSLTGNGIPAVPEIDILQGVTSIDSGSGSYDFGDVAVGGSSGNITFTIENNGTIDLNLTGGTTVSSDSVLFVVVQPAATTIPASGSTTFTIRFDPSGTGSESATITIDNDDSDEDPYTFTVTGNGVVFAPEIDVLQGVTSIDSGIGSYDFGDIEVGSSGSDITFTIENNGTIDLNLTGTPAVSVGGSDPGMFTITQSLPAAISASGSETFTISFSPLSIGAKSATITIDNDDSNENPYTFTVTGNGIAPEINVLQGVTSIASGSGSYDFGDVVDGSSGSDITFTIENTGAVDLNLTGVPVVDIAGSDPGMFAVTQPTASTISASGSTTFTISFDPSGTGAMSATISIDNDDSDEDPYTFDITGNGIPAVPEIDIQRVASIPCGTGSYFFGDVEKDTSSSDITFTIENTGTADLHLDGTPAVDIWGSDPGMFTIGQPSVTIIPASGSTTFTIRFDPTATGAMTATISIDNDDSDEDPYTFTVNGNGVEYVPEIDIFQGAASIASGTGSYDFGDVEVGNSSGNITFTVENNGTADLSFTGTPRVSISSEDPAIFPVDTQPSTPVTSGGSTTFSVAFEPHTTGTKTATVIIYNDDSDENPYTFTLNGTGTSTSGPDLTDTWTTSTDLPVALYGHASTVYNGYIYVLGGKSSSSYLSTVYYAPINGDGSVGSWTPTTPLPGTRCRLNALVYNGYIYVIGGENGSSKFANVYYAAINSDGTIGAWNSTTSLPAARSLMASTIYNGYLYVVGGETSATSNHVLYAPINANGTVGAWTTSSNTFTTPRVSPSAVAYDGYLYVLGGWDVSGNQALDSVYYASINGDGSVNSFSANTALSKPRSGQAGLLHNNCIYVVGGDGPDWPYNFYDIDYASIDGSGGLSTWNDTSYEFTDGRTGNTAVIYNDFIYVIGGWDEVSVYYDDVQYVQLQP